MPEARIKPRLNSAAKAALQKNTALWGWQFSMAWSSTFMPRFTCTLLGLSETWNRSGNNFLLLWRTILEYSRQTTASFYIHSDSNAFVPRQYFFPDVAAEALAATMQLYLDDVSKKTGRWEKLIKSMCMTSAHLHLEYRLRLEYTMSTGCTWPPQTLESSGWPLLSPQCGLDRVCLQHRDQHRDNKNNNGYSECLTCTGPKRLQIL